MNFFSKKNIKDKINTTNVFHLESLNENIFPYACLVADDVMLTKNGEVFQVIEFSLEDFKLNQEGGLRDKIRYAISENITDFKTAFWVQTIKRRKMTTTTQKHSKSQHQFLKRVEKVSKQMEENLNNYSVSVYITIIRQGRNFKMKYIKDYVSATILGHKHNKLLQENIQELQHITNTITNMLAIYNPKILGTRKEQENQEYSEIAEFLYYVINFESIKIPIQKIDITKQINDSKYLFKNGIMAIQSQSNDSLKLGMSFSLKEVPKITMSNVSDIVNNTRAEIIITEYISFVDQKRATMAFKEQKAFLQGRDDFRFQNDVGLSFLNNGADAKYCNSSLSVMVTAKDTKELQTFVNETIVFFSKHGIVMAREDIGLERNYYAMMPANFSATQRLTIHDAKEVGCFCYSYSPKQSSTTTFLNDITLFNIGTLKNNPVPIGLDKICPNVMIAGPENSGKTTMANFLASSILREFDADLFIIEFNCRSRAFIEAIGGEWYRVSCHRQQHTACFNGLNLDRFTNAEQKKNYLFEFFSLLLATNNVVITPEISVELKQAIDYIENYSNTHKKFAIHDVLAAFKDKSIDNELRTFHSIGKYYYLFDNREDVFNTDKSIAFHLDESIANNSGILALVINHIMLTLLQKSNEHTKPKIIILDEPFLTFGNAFFKAKLNKFLEQMADSNIYCIFTASNLEKESATIVDFTQLVLSCGMQMHFANRYADDNYGRIFRLEKLEHMSVKTVAGYEGRNLIVKNRDGLYSCKFEMDNFPKMAKLLSDKGEAQQEIFQIKEALQTDSYERWVPAYFDGFNSNQDGEAKRAVEKEIKAIQEIKHLMES